MRIDNAGSRTPVQKSVSSVGHKGNHFQVPEIMTRDSRVMRIIDDVWSQTLVQNLVSSTRHIGNHFQVPEIITKNSHEMRIDAESQTPLQTSVSSKGFTFRFRRLWQKIYVMWEYMRLVSDIKREGACNFWLQCARWFSKMLKKTDEWLWVCLKNVPSYSWAFLIRQLDNVYFPWLWRILRWKQQEIWLFN